MPLPKPRSGESQDDFMGRCMPEAMTGTDDREQAVAMCMRQWREKESRMALETETIAAVPIMRVGDGFHGEGCPPDGCRFTEEYLDELVETYWASRTEIEPPVKLGHDENQAFLQEDGLPAAGAVANVRRLGDRLFADLVNVPKQVAELIRSGAYRTVSVELMENKEIGGTKYGKILTGLALLGADLPAITGLGGITALYQKLQLKAEEGAVIEAYELNTEVRDRMDAIRAIITADSSADPSITPPVPAVQDTQGGDEMSDLTEVRRTLGIDEEADVIQAITSLKSQAVDIATGEKGEANALRRQLQDAQASYLELQAKAAQDILEMKDTSRKTEATYKVQAAIDSGRILPSDKDIAMDLALNSPERYDEFASKQRLDLRERGRQVDDALAAIEPTAEEIAIGKQMGQTREQLMAQKAADRGIKVPS